MDRFRKDLTGGMPLELDDLEYDENGILDSFAGLASGIAGQINVSNSVILSGCLVADLGANLQVFAGWILYNGEVVKVDDHVVADAGGAATWWWKLEETFDPAGLETFEDTVAKDTYRVRRMVLTNDTIDVPSPPEFYFDYNTLTSATMQDRLGLTEWDVIDDTALLTLFVKLNDNLNGTGTDFAPESNIGAGSFLKTKSIGKTVFFQFRLNDIEMLPTSGPPGPTYYAANSIKLNLFSGPVLQFEGTANFSANNYNAGNGRKHRMFISAGSNSLVIQPDFNTNLDIEFPASFNDGLTISYNNPSAVFAPAVIVGVNPTCTVYGEGFYEKT